ncbi:MAG TPA: glycoside hydrolase family 88 protein [Candidatus Limiplasma stercoravium]|nr:glycoside hydrolase family 88 protein [Candidatus Limiplasma stercoravium]
MKDALALAGRVLEKLTATHAGGGENDHLTLDTWEWPQGVAVYAMLKLWRATGDSAVLGRVRDWYEGHIARGLPPRNVNTTAPMLGLTVLYEHTRDARYRSLIEDWALWVINGMPRTQEGGLQHITTHDENPQQLWDDTLYMTVLFLLRAGLALQRPEWVAEAEYQLTLHIKYLHCPHNGLWYHGWTFEGRHHFGGAFWARGNAWITAGAPEFLEWMPQGAARRLLMETWREQCAALLPLQDAQTGLWHTLLDHADSYVETSASAAIAYGLLKGARLGWLGEDAARAGLRAAEGVAAQIGPDGWVANVSYGTPMGMDLDFYLGIPLRPTAYGQGLAFLMFTELIGAQ